MLTWHLVLVYILMLLYMYIAPGQGQTTFGDKCWCQQKALITLPIWCRFKKNCFEVRFYINFFHVSPYIYSPGARANNPLGTKFWWQQEGLFSLPICCKFSKWSLRNLILYTFLMLLYMYIAPGQGQKTPWGQTFDVNRKPLSLRPFVASFKQISLNSDFIHIF